MIRKYSLVFILIFSMGVFASQAQAITSGNIKQLVGEWKGSLTYMDYTTNKAYTLPANLKISQLSNSHQLIFTNIYPNEPKANDADTITFAKNGRMIGKEVVRSKTLLPNGNTEIVTEYVGIDGNENKPALIRHTYMLGKSIFVKRKEVQFEGTTELIKRHEYSYHRK